MADKWHFFNSKVWNSVTAEQLSKLVKIEKYMYLKGDKTPPGTPELILARPGLDHIIGPLKVTRYVAYTLLVWEIKACSSIPAYATLIPIKTNYCC